MSWENLSGWTVVCDVCAVRLRMPSYAVSASDELAHITENGWTIVERVTASVDPAKPGRISFPQRHACTEPLCEAVARLHPALDAKAHSSEHWDMPYWEDHGEGDDEEPSPP